jgi:signal transduction histidine kinase
MKIKTRLSLQFSFIVAAILIAFSLMVYFFSFTSQQSKFRETLLESAKNSAILLINVAEVDSILLKKIHQSTILLTEEEIVITTDSLIPEYNNKVHFLTHDVIKKNIPQNVLNFFSIMGKDGVCYRHNLNHQEYFVFVMAYDLTRKENLQELRKVLFWSILTSIILSVLLSYIFAKNAMKPIKTIIRQMQSINSPKLNQRIDEGNKKDEIAHLAISFNELLTKLELVFKNQEEFVSNASHELRTPLTVMIAEIDYILSRERNKNEYQEQLTRLADDLRDLNNLLNSLLELAQINSDKPLQLMEVRIDEVMYNAIHQVKEKHNNRKIIVKLEYPENDNDLLIVGNPGLLAIAFKNLIDNACKFSSDDVIVEFKIKSEDLLVIISDTGIGIPKQDLDNIYDPFRRASNVNFKSGFGIGLSLVKRIFEIHKVHLELQSTINKGTRFILGFKRVL